MKFNKNIVDNDLIFFDTRFNAPLLTIDFKILDFEQIQKSLKRTGFEVSKKNLDAMQHNDGTWRFIKIVPNGCFTSVIKHIFDYKFSHK